MSINARDLLNARATRGIAESRRFVKSEPSIRQNLNANLQEVADLLHQNEFDLDSTTEYALAMCDRFKDSPLWSAQASELDVLRVLARLDLDLTAFATDENHHSFVLGDLLQTLSYATTRAQREVARDDVIVAGLLCLALEQDNQLTRANQAA